MATKVQRKNNVVIDLHQVKYFPKVEDLHILVKNNLPATVDNLLSLEPDSYKHQVYLKTISPAVAERFVNYCQGKIAYEQNGVVYQLPVSILDEEFISVHVATIPYECTNEQISAFFFRLMERWLG